MSERVRWIDIAKGLLIVLVIFGHSQINSLTKMLINSFHMGAFFFISGITFNQSYSFENFLLKKWKSLLVPYIFFCLVMLTYQYLKAIIFKGFNFDLLSGLISIILPISGRNSTTVYGLWFLPCLFLTELIAYGALKTKEKYMINVLIQLVVICLLCLIFHRITGAISVVEILPVSLLFLFLGIKMRDESKVFDQNKLWLMYGSFVLFIITSLLNFHFWGHVVDLSSMTLGYWPLYLVSSLCGTLMICALAMYIKNNRLFIALGKDSIFYYGLHYEVLGVIEKIFRGGGLQTLLTFVILYPLVWYIRKHKSLIVRRQTR